MTQRLFVVRPPGHERQSFPVCGLWAHQDWTVWKRNNDSSGLPWRQTIAGWPSVVGGVIWALTCGHVFGRSHLSSSKRRGLLCRKPPSSNPSNRVVIPRGSAVEGKCCVLSRNLIRHPGTVLFNAAACNENVRLMCLHSVVFDVFSVVEQKHGNASDPKYAHKRGEDEPVITSVYWSANPCGTMWLRSKWILVEPIMFLLSPLSRLLNMSLFIDVSALRGIVSRLFMSYISEGCNICGFHVVLFDYIVEFIFSQ